MTLIPIASFLAGSLLTLLLPALLLTALVVWYVMVLRRHPEPDAGDALPAASASEVAPGASPGADPPARGA